MKKIRVHEEDLEEKVRERTKELRTANMALKHPDTFWWALCMSGRYEIRPFLDHHDSPQVYFNNPLAYVYNLAGGRPQRLRRGA